MNENQTQAPETSRRFLSPRRERFWVFCLFLIACIFRLGNIGEKSLWIDEAHWVHENQRPLSQITERCKVSNSPPLREYLLHFLGQGTPNQIATATRLPSALAGSLSVLLVYLLGRILFGQAAGWGAALFLLLHPWQIFHSQDSRMHVVSLFFSALVLWQLCRLLYGRHSLWQWALWGLALACYAWFTYLASMTFMALGAMIVVEWIKRMLRKEERPRAHRLVAGVALAGLVALVAYSPWLKVMTTLAKTYQVGETSQSAPPPRPAPTTEVPPAAAPQPPPPSPAPEKNVPYRTDMNSAYFKDLFLKMGGDQAIAATISLLLAFVGLAVMGMRHRGKLWIVAFWFLSPLPILKLTNAGYFFPPRYMLHFLAVYSLLVGLGAATLFQIIRKRIASKATLRKKWAANFLAAALAIGPLLVFQSLGLVKYYACEKQDWRSAMEYLGENIQPDDKLVVGLLWSIDGVRMYRDALGGVPYRLSTNNLTDAALEREISNEKNVWFIYCYDLPSHIQKVVAPHMKEMVRYPGVLGAVRIMRQRNYVIYQP